MIGLTSAANSEAGRILVQKGILIWLGAGVYFYLLEEQQRIPDLVLFRPGEGLGEGDGANPPSPGIALHLRPLRPKLSR